MGLGGWWCGEINDEVGVKENFPFGGKFYGDGLFAQA